METGGAQRMDWRTKPTDRFVLRFIKIYISAPLSQGLLKVYPETQSRTLTILAACIGIGGGIAFGIGIPLAGGLLAAVAQVFDGVDGQVARLTGKESPEGAFLDSVLDRYMDFALLFGMLLYCIRTSVLNPAWLILIGGLAAAGASQVSYTTARAASLGLDYHRPEFAGKGTRTTVIVLCGLLSPFWIHAPFIALLYLALHPNAGVIMSLSGLMGSHRKK